MVVTFRCNGRCFNYKPGTIYTAELTPRLKAVLEQDRHLSLIDPPSFDLPAQKQKRKPESEPKPITKKLSMKNEEEKLDYESQENI